MYEDGGNCVEGHSQQVVETCQGSKALQLVVHVAWRDVWTTGLRQRRIMTIESGHVTTNTG